MNNPTAPISKKARWTGYVLTVLPALLMIFSAVMKLMKSPEVVKGFADMGLPEGLILKIGTVELLCTLIYLIPRTSVLGAILLTGYLGGAVLANLHMGGYMFIMPVVLGIMFWGGLFLRDRRVRDLIPITK